MAYRSFQVRAYQDQDQGEHRPDYASYAPPDTDIHARQLPVDVIGIGRSSIADAFELRRYADFDA